MAQWIIAISLGIYMSSFSVGLGPMSQIIISEIYPTHLRGTGISMYLFFIYTIIKKDQHP